MSRIRKTAAGDVLVADDDYREVQERISKRKRIINTIVLIVFGSGAILILIALLHSR